MGDVVGGLPTVPTMPTMPGPVWWNDGYMLVVYM